MSLEAAGLLLDFAGVAGEGTAVRLAQAVEDLETFAPDARGAVELARVIAAGHFDAVSHDRAVDLVDVLAAVLGLQVHAGRHARLVEDLTALPAIIDDLDSRISALPTSGKFRRKIAEHAKGRRTKVADLPAGELFRLAEGIERSEQSLTRRAPGEAA